MKLRIMSLWVVFSIMAMNLISCQSTPKQTHESVNDDTVVDTIPPSYYKTWTFYDYAQFASWITKDENGNASATEDLSDFTDRYVEFINNVVEDEVQILSPNIENDLWHQESEIVVMAYEWLGLPSVWYYYRVDNEDDNMIVLIYYLNDEERAFLERNNIVNFINEYAPNYPKPGEVNLSAGVLSVTENELYLKDRVVTAITRKSTKHRHQTLFAYDDVIVSVEPSVELDDVSWESFWSNFSLEPSPVYSLMSE